MGGTRGRVGIKDVSDPNFIVLRCPLNLLRIFQDVAHRSKTEFMLGPSSGVKIKKKLDIQCTRYTCTVYARFLVSCIFINYN